MLDRSLARLRWPLAAVGLSLGAAFFAYPSLSGADDDKGRRTEADRKDDRDDDDRDCDRLDPVTLTFSTVGDSRQDDVAPDPTTLPMTKQDQIWLQNTKAWSRIMRSVEGARSNFLFFNGDMIMGYGKAAAPAATDVSTVVGSDLMKFYRQYAFWRGMVADLMETGTYVVPVPGNHETQSKALGKKAQVENEDAWRANMGDLILDTDRFQTLFGEGPSAMNTTGGLPTPDGLATDQKQLSYSFDFRGSHFAVVNTDPVGSDAHAPTKWLAQDLADAKTRGAKHCFVFGHKPAFTYYYGTPVAPPAIPLPGKASGLDASPGTTAARDAFWDVIEQYGATYFCGHEHIFNLMQPRGAGHAWQVLVGSGGSPFEAKPTDATIAVTDRYYAWADVKVRKSGKVEIRAYGFDDQFGPTKLIQKLKLPQ